MRERDARDAVQFRLGFVSLVIWLVVAFGLVAVFTVAHVSRAPLLLLIGALALGVAALPWLGYRGMVRAELRARRGAREPDAPGQPSGQGEDSA